MGTSRQRVGVGYWSRVTRLAPERKSSGAERSHQDVRLVADPPQRGFVGGPSGVGKWYNIAGNSPNSRSPPFAETGGTQICAPARLFGPFGARSCPPRAWLTAWPHVFT